MCHTGRPHSRLSAVQQNGCRDTNLIGTCWLPCAVPHPPTIVDVAQTDPRTVILSWAVSDLSTSSVTHFEVTLSAEGGAVERSAVVPASAAQTFYNATFEGLSELQRYSYQVRGFSEDGPGNYSNARALTLGELSPHVPQQSVPWHVCVCVCGWVCGRCVGGVCGVRGRCLCMVCVCV